MYHDQISSGRHLPPGISELLPYKSIIFELPWIAPSAKCHRHHETGQKETEAPPKNGMLESFSAVQITLHDFL
jgi:hypothetical protein